VLSSWYVRYPHTVTQVPLCNRYGDRHWIQSPLELRYKQVDGWQVANVVLMIYPMGHVYTHDALNR